jgi:hypothetical protein
MPKVSDVCRIRSKNAGPFWVTLDVFFDSDYFYEQYADHVIFSKEAIGQLYDIDSDVVRVYQVPTLNVCKVSYARPNAQGWRGERDMHSGQQFVRLLDLELD